jgi:hypothetical protein
MRFLAMVLLILGAFFVTSRLQVNENARFVTRSGEVLEGRVSRDFATGQYKIETAGGTIRYVSQDNLGAMSFEGDAIPWYAGTLGFLLIIVAGCVGFGVDRLSIGSMSWRAARDADVAIARRQAELESSVREHLSK